MVDVPHVIFDFWPFFVLLEGSSRFPFPDRRIRFRGQSSISLVTQSNCVESRSSPQRYANLKAYHTYIHCMFLLSSLIPFDHLICRFSSEPLIAPIRRIFGGEFLARTFDPSHLLSKIYLKFSLSSFCSVHFTLLSLTSHTTFASKRRYRKMTL